MFVVVSSGSEYRRREGFVWYIDGVLGIIELYFFRTIKINVELRLWIILGLRF